MNEKGDLVWSPSVVSEYDVLFLCIVPYNFTR